MLLGRIAAGEPTAEVELVTAGAAAVGPVLRALCDESSPIPWHLLTGVLQRIGEASFAPLVSALAAAPTAEVARRCSGPRPARHRHRPWCARPDRLRSRTPEHPGSAEDLGVTDLGQIRGQIREPEVGVQPPHQLVGQG